MYVALTKKYKEQSPRDVFCQLYTFRSPNETWEAPLIKLAQMAVKEEWNYTNENSKRPNNNYPILLEYLNNTFLQIQKQDKFSYSADAKRVCFNTGLQTSSRKDIFATFYGNYSADERNLPDWTLYGFFDSSSEKISEFEPLPDIATYITDPSDLVFDHTYDFEIDYGHILAQNKSRLPIEFQNNNTVVMNLLDGACSQLRERLKRNFKLAIPHWYDNKIQLLLPLYLTNTTHADAALVAEKDTFRKKYIIKTILTMDMAYLDARIICAPDPQWLTP